MLDKYRKPERSNRTTDVTLLLDMSGSMQPRRDETIREVNRYLNNLRNDGQRYRITVKTFNTYVDTLISNRPIEDVGPLEHSEYRPQGWTRLLDAVGQSLQPFCTGGLSDGLNRRLFVVVTDGEENDSRTYGLQEVRTLIDGRRSENFQFVFLGNGPGSWRIGRNLGFNISVATDWSNPWNTDNIYQSLTTASASYSTGRPIKASMFNTDSTEARVTVPSQDNTGGSTNSSD